MLDKPKKCLFVSHSRIEFCNLFRCRYHAWHAHCECKWLCLRRPLLNFLKRHRPEHRSKALNNTTNIYSTAHSDACETAKRPKMPCRIPFSQRLLARNDFLETQVNGPGSPEF